MLLRIDSTYFCAGAILNNEVCVEAAPIIKYMVGWKFGKIMDYSNQKRWNVQVLPD
jgi:hypothetical protein